MPISCSCDISSPCKSRSCFKLVHQKCLLFQMGDADKDFRYMALTDLMSELQKESLSLDSDTEEKVTVGF